jgi:hypothetical protein
VDYTGPNLSLLTLGVQRGLPERNPRAVNQRSGQKRYPQWPSPGRRDLISKSSHPTDLLIRVRGDVICQRALAGTWQAIGGRDVDVNEATRVTRITDGSDADITLDAVQRLTPALVHSTVQIRAHPAIEAETGTDDDYRQCRAPAVGADVVVNPNEPNRLSFVADFHGHCGRPSCRCS